MYSELPSVDTSTPTAKYFARGPVDAEKMEESKVEHKLVKTRIMPVMTLFMR